MAKMLSFIGPVVGQVEDVKTHKAETRPNASMGWLRVVSTVLPTGERLPMLVNESTWAPRSMALRWILYDRRYSCAESTLRRDVNLAEPARQQQQWLARHATGHVSDAPLALHDADVLLVQLRRSMDRIRPLISEWNRRAAASTEPPAFSPSPSIDALLWAVTGSHSPNGITA